ncbi:MAG TPA: helix-turn-helix domain-containing protein [Dinghuibacter sp.]|jgi:AraC-like DNA-binding protein|uniref:helix-turn-helix domain-containing protein n=1 Tax=Dinghuibacter sp. TaxID=2024697 RepID=UPI002CC50739|nr:helix-turn-helix domain-containing protein [Dinghuibacter sp.]HTJ10595.1 helix-turn-helix domain-containing protein [Dinghuibacter sp.]
MQCKNSEVRIVGDDLIITNILLAGKRTDTQVHQLLRKVELLLRIPQGYDVEWRQQFEQVALEETSNPALTVGHLADRMNLSVSTLGRLCYRAYGLSPMKYVFNLRLERAALLLAQNYGRVKDVAYETGFSSLSYFSKCYKERYGVPPRMVLSGQVA